MKPPITGTFPSRTSGCTIARALGDRVRLRLGAS